MKLPPFAKELITITTLWSAGLLVFGGIIYGTLYLCDQSNPRWIVITICFASLPAFLVFIRLVGMFLEWLNEE